LAGKTASVKDGGSFAEQNKAATRQAAPTAGADGDLDPALVSTICWALKF
jgi:hypothetical protein